MIRREFICFLGQIAVVGSACHTFAAGGEGGSSLGLEVPRSARSKGWPDAANCGVPSGTALINSGTLTVTQEGTVIEGKDISGKLDIRANNVTIRRCKIRAADHQVINIWEGRTGTRVEDCEIDGTGQGPAGQHGIAGAGRFLRNNIHHVVNGINIEGSNSLVEGNYIHDLLAGGGDPHYDGIQISGGLNNVTVRNNTVFGRDTSCVFIVNDFGAIDNVLVENNKLIGQNDAAYTIYVVEKQGNPAQITNVTIRNNVLGRGWAGYASIERTEPTWTNNTDFVTGASIPRP
jgi:hypothetical protein